MIELKCKKCRHYYVRMAGANGTGFNPAPSCWLYEDTGRRPTILTQECFESKRKTKTEKEKRNGRK